MKKFICALLSLAMLALFAGCRDQTQPREALKLKLRTHLRLRRAPLHRKQIPKPHPLKRQKQMPLQAELQPSRQNSRLFLPASLPS